MSNTVELLPKLVGEVAPRTFDFTSKLAVGETIASQAVTAAVYSGNDVVPTSILSGAPTTSGAVVTQNFAAGVLGTIYACTCTVQTSLSHTFQLSGYLAIIPALV